MSDFHYVRTLGDDGGVDACSGAAIGLDLGSVLRDGLPPFGVVLQIIAGLCEILDIAEEDGQVHGNIDLGMLFVDDTGAVSLEGFGQRRTRAPEGRPQGSVTDLYGLGCVGFHLFAGYALPKVNLKHRDEHDDDVIDAILEIKFGDLKEEMVGDVQWFLAKLLSFDPAERPTAVETWRTFIAFAEEAGGPDFVSWCLDALDGGGQRRSAEGGVIESATAESSPETQDLGGPMMSRGPLEKGGMAFSTANVAGGTAFFTKADMKAALAKGPVESPRDRQPAVGGGSTTNYWSRDQLKAMANNAQEAPRPKRAAGEGARRRTLVTSKEDLERERQREAAAVKRIPAPASPVPLPSRPPGGPLPLDEPQTIEPHPFASDFDEGALGGEETVRMPISKVRTTQTPAPAPQVYRPPGAPVKTDASHEDPPPKAVNLPAPAPEQRRPPTAKAPPKPPVPPYEPEDYDASEDGGNVNLVLGGVIIVVVVIALVVCMGLGGLSAALAFFSGGGTVTEEPVPITAPIPPVAPGLPGSLPAVEPVPPPDTEAVERPAPIPIPSSAPRPKPSPVRPRPSPVRPKPSPVRPKPSPVQPSTGSRPPPGPIGRRPDPSPSSEPSTPANLNTAPVTLTLKTRDRGRLSCCGDNRSFDGQVSLNIEAYKLPCTCLITIGKKNNAFQVKGTGSVSCSKTKNEVSCNKSVVK